MSTLTAGPASTSEDSDFLTVEPVTPARVLRSEWIKMRSLRSTALTLLAGIVSMVALGWIFGWANNANWSELNPDEQASFSPIDATLAGYHLAQLAIGVLGVLLVTGEYATGMIRATFGAVPRRSPVLWAKVTLYMGVTFILMLGAAVAAFVGGQQLLGTHGDDPVSRRRGTGHHRSRRIPRPDRSVLRGARLHHPQHCRQRRHPVRVAARVADPRVAASLQLARQPPAVPAQQRRRHDVQRANGHRRPVTDDEPLGAAGLGQGISARMRVPRSGGLSR